MCLRKESGRGCFSLIKTASVLLGIGKDGLECDGAVIFWRTLAEFCVNLWDRSAHTEWSRHQTHSAAPLSSSFCFYVLKRSKWNKLHGKTFAPAAERHVHNLAASLFQPSRAIVFVLLTTDFLINRKYAHRRQKRSSAPQLQPSRTHKRGEYKIYQMEIWGTPPRAPQYCSH